ncbi:DnaA N-terminal domain-containing protein [Clostridium sp.]|uniref:DnaA N-terminal domain-containing protein n=1 Tax=Clostridium sp. TaxID=1506 RepID=UPI002912165C|nr:DnaA N-terminal domain-containing protein [Clostridium sp.]MDU4477660.1 DnaA N-terminal domain-containing protein [Clostridium sp.]
MEKESKGFIKLERSIFEHWIFQDAEKFKAFVDLIQLARWKGEKLLIGNKLITIPRGSYYTSELKLAERWGWSRNKTRDFLKLLESEKMITKKGTSKGTTLTITNYEFYQGEGTTNDTTKRISKSTSEKHQKVHQKNIKRYTKEEIKEIKRIDKKLEEGKEDTTQPSILSFPTPTHEQIFNQFGEISYKTWLSNLDITDDEIVIYAANKPFEDLIKKRYVDSIETLTGKTVSVKGKEVS